MVKVGMVYSRIRNDEKMLVEAAQRKGIELVPIFDDEAVLDIHARPWDVDVVLERSISFYRGLYVLKFAGSHGIPCVNTYEVASRCGDKAETSLLLARAGVRTPRTRVAFTPEAAIRACRELGFPAVLKPTMGSWARLLAKVDNEEQADMVLEHKEALGNPLQQVSYAQESVRTPEPAIRACRELGFPAVLKPTMGSWARLLAKVDNEEQADMVLEHKEALGNPLQ